MRFACAAAKKYHEPGMRAIQAVTVSGMTRSIDTPVGQQSSPEAAASALVDALVCVMGHYVKGLSERCAPAHARLQLL